MTAAPLLQAHDIALGYRNAAATTWVLQNFAMAVAKGELVALLGPSGVGKSSLLRVLAGLQAPQQGEVRLHGEKLTAPHPRAALVFQQAALLPWLKVHENVAFGLTFSHQPAIGREAVRQRVHDAMQEVGLLHAAQSYPAALSGGMAQRVALARALARQPELILLDEPFSALDESTRAAMQTLLRGIVSQHGSAAVLVTHDIDEALSVADRVLLIGHTPGRLIGQWRLSSPYPREDVAISHNALRLEILHTLHTARQQQLQAQTVDYVI